MRRPKTFIICCVILLAIVASGVIIPWVKREQTLKEIKEQHEAELEILAAYPWIDEIDTDNIAKLTTCEGDIVYTVTDKEAIAEVMGIIRDTNPQPVIINPEDDKGRPAGGPKNALWLDITTKDDKESWSLTIDDENFPTDFVIDHTIYKNRDTGWFETTTGYFTKPDKIYGKIKAIMYKGERTDLNEVSDTKHDEPVKWNRVDFEYNPDAIFTAEPLTITDKEGLYTTDIKCDYGKYFFTRIKVDEDLILSEISCDDKLRFKYFWGYMDENGDNETEFALKSTDPEKPYYGIHKLIGVTEDRVYAMTFHAGKNDHSEDKIYYLTAFDMSGNAVAEKQYPYKIGYTTQVQSFITRDGNILVFNGATALFDEEFNEIALNTDHRIKMVVPTDSPTHAEIAVLLEKEEGYNRAILDDKDLSIVSEDDHSYDLKDYRIVEMPNQSTLIMVKWESEGYRSKLVELTFDVGYETDLIDTFHSGIDDLEILGIVSRTQDEILCKTEGEQWYVGEVKLIRFTRVDRNVAAKRKLIKVYSDDISVRGFNALSTDYYAEECYNGSTSFFSSIENSSDLSSLLRQEVKPDVICLYKAKPDVIRTEDAADISALLAKDEDLSEEDFFPGLLNALTYKGALRAIPVTAEFESIVAPSNLLNGEPLTYEAFSKLLKDNLDTKLFYNIGRLLMDRILQSYGNPFYNPDKGIYNFESDDFKNLVRVIGNLDWDVPEEYYSDDYESKKNSDPWLKKLQEEGAKLFVLGYSAVFYDSADIYSLYGKDYDFVGYPSEDGSGGCFKEPQICVINSLSEEKEGALEFIKYVLDNPYKYRYPATIQGYDELADYYLNDDSYADKSGQAAKKIFMDKLKEAMLSAQGCSYDYPNDTVYDFIENSLARYYAGRTTLDETARAIQVYFAGRK